MNTLRIALKSVLLASALAASFQVISQETAPTEETPPPVVAPTPAPVPAPVQPEEGHGHGDHGHSHD